MRVALVTHDPLPVRGYGGTPRIVVWLARGLRELGHEVTIVARKGSRLEGFQVRSVPPRRFQRLYYEPEYDASEVLPPNADVAHFPARVRCRVPIPHLTTIHGNEFPGGHPPNTVFLSRDHMARMGGHHFVYNGVDSDEYEFRSEKDDYYLFLGKTGRRVKGVEVAERVARRAGVRLVVAGGWRLRWSRRIRWVGTVTGRLKAELLAGARALLFPIQWEEPFGLVVAEAWMSGTPVLATARGSMPELVRPDVGRLCTSEAELVEAVRARERDPALFDAERCRTYAMERFHHVRMAREYAALYGRAVSEGWGLRKAD